ncbi:DUF3592 domain-containing protein [Gilvimarinus polysaccharolyticus]|uniref:DUF3592 domain-containing protein n=1 Tax=Gilvimarinus polysaccharolyticus TaxID=863921 RepID=UPI0006739726|nr:DUF3592 domain-containing protein [Gilvimarinus polysaccharolyticus]
MAQGTTYRQAGAKASGGLWAKVKKRWVVLLFGLPFAGVGVGMLLFGVLPQLLDWQSMKQWQPVVAQVSQAELKVSHGDDSTTYKPTAQYSYQFQGQHYRGSRVAISDSYDNVGDFNVDLGRRLERAASSNAPVTAYVNPSNPGEAVLNRELRLGMIGFKMVFVVLFGGVGIGIIAYLLLAPLDEINGVTEGDKPWLTRRAWASSSIKSNGKHMMIFVWCFAAFWNAIAIPTGINCIYEFNKGNNLALFGLLFLLVGAGLLYWAVKETAKWRRFGPAPLQLDPYPGAIGGQVGGFIEVDLPYDSNHRFKVTLQCLESYYSGSGKERKRHERCVWQREGYAHTQLSAHGTRLEILFDVKEGLPESEPVKNRYHLWRLNVAAQLPGADFDRSYEVPVFATGANAMGLRESSEEHRHAHQEREQLLESALQIKQIPGGITMYYPAFSQALAKVMGVLFGAGFCAAGYFIDATFMGAVFFLIGALVGLGCLYFLLTSLDVKIDQQGLFTRRKLLGFPVNTTKVARHELTHLKIAESYSSQSGKSHVTYFKVQAHRNTGKPVTIGYNFAGEAVAEQALESISVLTGVPQA